MSASLHAFEQDDVTRQLPHSLGPEKAVLSCILQEPEEVLPRVIEAKITEHHFYLPAHSLLFRLLVEQFEAGKQIEFVSFIQAALDQGTLDRMGGPHGLTDLYSYQPTIQHLSHHLGILRQKRVLRGIISVSGEAIAECYDSPDEADGMLDAIEAKLTALRDGECVSEAASIKQSVMGVISELEGILSGAQTEIGIPTGFDELDRMSGGLKPGEVFVVAARPSMGKTSFMMNIVEHVALVAGRAAMVFSAEMTNHQLASRLVYSRARFNFSSLARGARPDKGDLLRIKRATTEIAAAPIMIDDTAGISIGELRAKARRAHRDGKVEFIAIDYLQLMKSRSKQALNSREREIGEISAGIKALAKELHVPILLLAQLNRDSEKRTGKLKGIPRMADLRESGNIEQDADLIGLLHRSDYFAEDDEEKKSCAGLAKLILAKNRNGGTGDVPLTFVAELMRFESGAPARDETEMFPPTPKSRHEY